MRDEGLSRPVRVLLRCASGLNNFSCSFCVFDVTELFSLWTETPPPQSFVSSSQEILTPNTHAPHATCCHIHKQVIPVGTKGTQTLQKKHPAQLLLRLAMNLNLSVCCITPQKNRIHLNVMRFTKRSYKATKLSVILTDSQRSRPHELCKCQAVCIGGQRTDTVHFSQSLCLQLNLPAIDQCKLNRTWPMLDLFGERTYIHMRDN